jgi:hypothetical protein
VDLRKKEIKLSDNILNSACGKTNFELPKIEFEPIENGKNSGFGKITNDTRKKLFPAQGERNIPGSFSAD